MDKSIEEMQIAIMLAANKKKKSKRKNEASKLTKDEKQDQKNTKEKSKFKNKDDNEINKKRKKEIGEATIFSRIAAKLNVNLNDLREISKLPEGGHNTAELEQDLKYNKGEGIKKKIKDLHEVKEKEEQESFVHKLHLEPHHQHSFVQDIEVERNKNQSHKHSFVKDLEEERNKNQDHEH